MKRFLTMGSFFAFAFVAACSSSDASPGQTDSGTADSSAHHDAGSATDSAVADASAVAIGQQLVGEAACGTCHGSNLAGGVNGIPHYAGVYGPNITPDKDTGIGGWTDDQIKGAIKTGIDDQGSSLCFIMPRFTLSDRELTSIIAYLRSVPAVKQTPPDSTCPNDGGTSDDGGGK